MTAWRGWYHVTSNTYGTWLPGDPRGWRDRGHRIHVAGDYKHPPPPGCHEPIRQNADALLKQDPVHLDHAEREVSGTALVEMLLLKQSIEVLALCVDGIHFHVLARFPDGEVRPRIGRAKKHATFSLRDAGGSGRVWETGCHVEPVKDRQHQMNVFNYICAHQQKGAWLWTFCDKPPAPRTQSGGVD